MILPDAKIEATLQWLLQTTATTQHKGSAAWYGPWHRWYRGGWEKAYPETSGYIIPTLLHYSERLARPNLQREAFQLANWLTQIQMPSGAWCSGVVGGQTPSFFNTAMVWWGLPSVWQLNRDPKILEALACSAAWLIKTQAPDGHWRAHAYTESYLPLYYAYAYAALHAGALIIDHTPLADAAERGLNVLVKSIKSGFSDMGFAPHQPAFSHTVGYTMQGLLYASEVFDTPVFLKVLDVLLADIEHIMIERGGLPNLFGNNDAIKKDTSICVTGHFQVAACLWRLGKKEKALALMNVAEMAQVISPKQPNIHGAWPGSFPIAGPYMAHKYPNWAAKFYLDCRAIMME